MPPSLRPGFETQVSVESAAPTPPTASTRAEARFGELGPLGMGGLGVVTAVRDRLLGRTVARKRLRGAGTPDPGRADRLWREARITAELEHPGVIPVYDAGIDDQGGPWYAMRHVEGQTLAESIADARHREDRLRLVGRLLAAAETLAFAHARGVVHCDVKPSNILLGPFGETLVIDWGMARAGAPGPALPSDGPVGGGTPAYMSPERLAGAPPDASADCWSLGVILYELLSGGGPPRWEPSIPDWTARLVDGVGRPPPPRDLLAIALRALAPTPRARYPDAGAFARDLRTWTEGRFVGAHAYSLREAAALLARRHRAALVLACLALAGIAVTAGIGWSSTRTEAERALLAATHAEAATARAVERLARLALARAEVALREERWGEAEVLAAASLAWAENAETRGLLWSTSSRRRPTMLREETLPRRCESVVVRADGGALLCLEADGLSQWSLGPVAPRWRRDGPVRQAFFVGERVLIHDANLAWSLLASDGSPVGTVLHGDVGPTPGTLHARGEGDAFGWAAGYDLYLEEREPYVLTRRRLCADATITALALRPDLGVLLHTCGQRGPVVDGQGRARALEGAEPTLLRASSDGGRVLLGRRDAALDVLDATGRHLRTISGSLRDARTATWTADGSLAAIAGDDPGIWLIEPDAGRSLGRLPAAHGTLAGTAGGAAVLAATGPETTRLSWWAPLAQEHDTRSASSVGLADACLSPDGGKVAAARSDGEFHVSRPDGTPLWSARWQSRVVKRCAWSPDGSLLAAAGIDDSAVRVFAGDSGAEHARLETPAPVRTLAFAHGGAHLVASTYGRGYVVFEVGSGRRLRAERADHEVAWLDALEDASAVVGLAYSGTVLVYDPETAALRPVTRLEGGAGLAVSPGRIAVGLPQERAIALLDLHTGARSGDLATGSPVSGDLSLSPDGRWMAVGGVDGWLRVWDVERQRLHASLRAGAVRVPVVRFGGGGRWLLTAGWDGAFALYPSDRLGWSPERWRQDAQTRWGLAVDQLLDVAR